MVSWDSEGTASGSSHSPFSCIRTNGCDVYVARTARRSSGSMCGRNLCIKELQIITTFDGRFLVGTPTGHPLAFPSGINAARPGGCHWRVCRPRTRTQRESGRAHVCFNQPAWLGSRYFGWLLSSSEFVLHCTDSGLPERPSPSDADQNGHDDFNGAHPGCGLRDPLRGRPYFYTGGNGSNHRGLARVEAAAFRVCPWPKPSGGPLAD